MKREEYTDCPNCHYMWNNRFCTNCGWSASDKPPHPLGGLAGKLYGKPPDETVVPTLLCILAIIGFCTWLYLRTH